VKRGADRHYELLSVRKMPEVIVGSGYWLHHPHAHMYMWVTNNYLEDGLWLMKQLGFEYKTNIVWSKERAGLGQYFRGKHELLLFGVHGKGKDPSVCTERKDITTVLPNAEHSRVHSRKPTSVFELVEARSHGPYTEFFGAPELPLRAGWQRWGFGRYSPAKAVGQTDAVEPLA
jgi:N6-adenosine-specific RNA methylase IME4